MSDYHPPTDLEELLTQRSSKCPEFITEHYHDSLTWFVRAVYDREWHFPNADQHQAALDLRDAVLRLRRDGAFVAVPLFRVNTDPIGPHPLVRPIIPFLEINHFQVDPRLIRDLGPFDLVSLRIFVPLYEQG
ncbi:hypothetical protein DFJ58DRAFT_883114 [Suillus subalutaceus]|uniref:uncharacterized protein n=1 Tax=Suillus subalutaceus TaxID=48586 RepID=UPI001B86EA36|nr:uncharacterized protein DFJ58DRAFT_883114 [Suillus subalutaceus]KAG1825054.1 hypothetical protein DFJ58DRAFT_883114 [Suillus subalutaceus]